MMPFLAWVRSLVWWDFRVAVALTVVVPLGLLAWAAWIRHQPLAQMMVIYWQVSSLLAITVYLMIGGFPISFLTGAAARALIPFGLWFWQDLSESIASFGGAASRAFQIWRWILSVYMAVGLIFSGAFLPCSFRQPLAPLCQVWFEPPLQFRQIFHPNVPVEALGAIGILGLVAYVLYGSFALWRLQRQQTQL